MQDEANNCGASGRATHEQNPQAVSAVPVGIPDAGTVYYSEPYPMFIEHVSDAFGDPTVELWRFTSCEDDGEDGVGFLVIRVHEIIETERSGTLAVYYRQWIAPDGKPAWGNKPKRVVASVSSLRALLRRRNMTAQGMEARQGGDEGSVHDSPVPKECAQPDPSIIRSETDAG